MHKYMQRYVQFSDVGRDVRGARHDLIGCPRAGVDGKWRATARMKGISVRGGEREAD
jgi:hypothetical protein